MDPIMPKPSKYKGATYKSRLEARWAIYLDNHPHVLAWVYEPKTFKMFGTGWTYTPDFMVLVKTSDRLPAHKFYIEVKPSIPTADYIQNLKRYTFDLPLVIASGDFTTSIHWTMPLTPEFTNTFLVTNGKARNFAIFHRFDLESSNAPRRSRKKKSVPRTDRVRRKGKGQRRKRRGG